MLQGAAIVVSSLALTLVSIESLGDTATISVDDGRVRAAGIRKLVGVHIDLYTDLPSGPAVDSLPAAFDAAVPQWAAYFGVDPARTDDWKVRAFVIGDRAKFDALGLMPVGQEFEHGYAIGNDIWLYDQPSDYYRRHLLLHEGTHAFMAKFLGGCGPGWYMEGTAELLSTHRLGAEGTEQGAGGRKSGIEKKVLTLNIMPRDRREVPYLGRVKLVHEAIAVGKPPTFPMVLELDNSKQLGSTAYAWCWVAAKLLDSNPRYRERFRALKQHAADKDFNDIVRREFADDWSDLAAEWQATVAGLDYGYDFERMAIDFQRGMPLNGMPRTTSIAADRGWQSSGVWLEQGKPYTVSASGRYQVDVEQTPEGTRDVPCEPGGITLEYHDGRPLGMLIGAIVDGEASGEATFAKPMAIGTGNTITPPRSGTLYLRVNDSAARLGDNRGRLTITVEP
jgi:hypothetical protein